MKPTVLCQICGKMIELTNFNFDKHRVCGKKCYQEWNWRHTLAILGEEYRVDVKKMSAADIMQEAGVPNMLEGRTLNLRVE
jgi:hypothetical protein